MQGALHNWNHSLTRFYLLLLWSNNNNVSLVCIVIGVYLARSISAGMRIYFRPFTISLKPIVEIMCKVFSFFLEPACSLHCSSRIIMVHVLSKGVYPYAIALYYIIIIKVIDDVRDVYEYVILYRCIWKMGSGTHMLHIII